MRIDSLLPALCCAMSLIAQDSKLTLEPFSAKTPDGRDVRAERGRLSVPENRRREGSRMIELAFVRLRSDAKEPGPPLIYLHGGPGGSATSSARDLAYRALWASLLELGDVVLLDQRGCGLSQPSLTVSIGRPPPADWLTSRAALERGFADGAAEVAAKLRAQGVDWTGYDTEQNADDVDALRAALGYQKMRLLGFSYGTHLALSVLRRHGGQVERAILIGTEGLDQTSKLPSAYDTHLRKLAALVAADPAVRDDVPDFVALLRAALAKLDQKPLDVEVQNPRDGSKVTLPVGADGLRMLLVRDVGDTSDLPVFPRLLHEVAAGETAVLRWFVQKRWSQAGMFPVLLFTMDPASGCAPERAARIEREAKTALLGNAMNFAFPAVEAVFAMPVLGDAFRAPVVSSVPVLFLSGTLDANTPPQQAEEARWGFAHAVHLVQRHGGHEDWLRNPKVAPVLRAFLEGKDVAHADVDMPPLRFAPVRGDAAGFDHPSLGTR